ncbi:MAG: response regulator transcription factor [Acidobacteria bacterium]|nr:response regulator transcription factor [Acidobacteriota bacterium]
MKILVAEDDAICRRLLEGTLRGWGYQAVACVDGERALDELMKPEAPSVAILDWMMPGLDGVDVCRRVRAEKAFKTPPYLIMLTANNRHEDIVAGLDAGADDYMVKPFNVDELRARVQCGVRVVSLQKALADRIQELEEAMSRVKRLQGLLPICAYCKRIRDGRNYWNQVDQYIGEHADVQFSHGVCPECSSALDEEIESHAQERRRRE